MNSTGNIGREIGTALAVLAIYLLTVLAPMQLARASQLDFQALGYTTPQSSWVLCSSADAGGADTNIAVAKCPATGVGKSDLVVPVSDMVPVQHEIVLVAPLWTVLPVYSPAPVAPSAWPRAPPVPV